MDEWMYRVSLTHLNTAKNSAVFKRVGEFLQNKGEGGGRGQVALMYTLVNFHVTSS